MASILIKNPPENIHRWLRATAERNRRSMNQQAIIWLQWCVNAEMQGGLGTGANRQGKVVTDEGSDLPEWFGVGRKHGNKRPRRHDMEAIRESIGKGIAQGLSGK